MAIIGISGKIGSGKDTVGQIIQVLCFLEGRGIPFSIEAFNYNLEKNFSNGKYFGDWHIKKFAGKLKQIVSILTGCRVEDLEDAEFKNKTLGEEWAKNKTFKSIGGEGWESDGIEYKREIPTYRWLLQAVGTEAMRQVIHENTWVNALFADYKAKTTNIVSGTATPLGNGKYRVDSVPLKSLEGHIGKIINSEEWQAFTDEYSVEPNWIITDTRFPNEADAIKQRGGKLIRIERESGSYSTHPSETALNNYHDFDYVIDNNGSMESLVSEVRNVLINEGILKITNSVAK